MGFRWQQLDNEDDFELLCLRYLRHEWKCPGLQRFGKRGERQFGIDLIDPTGSKPIRAAQCKHHEMDKTIPFHEVEAEIEKAKQYPIPLEEYFILTTARKTADLQTKLHALNLAHRHQGLFIVTVLTWQDIEERLSDIGEDIRDQIINGDTGRSVPDLVRMIRESVTEAPPRTGGDNEEIEHHLDHVKELIDNHEHRLARTTLDRLERRDFDRMSDRQRYRTLALLANTRITDGDFQEAGKLLLRAGRFQPEDEKAQVNEALAYELLADPTKAHALAQKLKDKYPHSSKAASIWLRTTSPERPLSEILPGVSDLLRKDAEVAAALVFLALRRKEIPYALEYAPFIVSASPAWPGGWMTHGQALHIAAWETATGPKRKAMLREAEAAYTKAIGLAKNQHVAYIEAQCLLNRGIVRDVLGEPGAEADLRTAASLEPSDPGFARRYALLLAVRGELDEAVILARQAWETDKGSESAEFLATVLYDRNKGDDRKEALALANDILTCAPSRHASDALDLIVSFHLENNDIQAAQNAVMNVSETSVPVVVKEAFHAQILLAQGKRDEATRVLEDVAGQLPSDLSREDRWRIARRFTQADLNKEALKVFESIAIPGQFDFLTQQLLDCATKAERDDVLLRVLRELREAGVRDRRVLWNEIAILQRYDPDEAVRICDQLVREDPSNKDMRLCLSVMGIRLGRQELGCSDPSLLLSVEEAKPATKGGLVVRVLLNVGQNAAALQYAYKLLRLNFRDVVAHYVYCFLFLTQPFRSNRPEPQLETPSHAGPGSAVSFEEEGAPPRWIVIEDNPPICPECNEIEPSHLLAVALSGKKVGDLTVLAESTIQNRKALITGILSKFVYRFQDCMENFQLRFPEEHGFQMVRVGTTDESGVTTYDFSAVKRSLEQKKAYVLELIRLYREQPVPLHMLATFTGTDVFEVMRHLAGSPNERIRTCVGSVEERQNALDALQEGGTFVIDTTALFTLLLLGRTEVLGGWLKRPIVSRRSREVVTQLLKAAQEDPSTSILGLDQRGELATTKATPEALSAYAGRLNWLLAAIDQYCQVLSCPKLAELSPEERHHLVDAFGPDGAESLLLATERNRILWTDDWVLAGYGQSKHQCRRVWTQIVLQGAAVSGTLDWNSFNADTARLLQANYVHTWWTPQIFEQAAQQANWQSSSPLLRPFLRDLASPNIVPEARLILGAAAIRSCYHANLAPLERNRFVVAVMNRLAVLHDVEVAGWGVIEILKRFCAQELEAARDLRAVIQVWLGWELSTRDLRTFFCDMSVVEAV
jgi:tetratricopeptide (TPR) repeat protein